MLLEVLHGHGGEVEELVSHFVRPLKARSLTDVPQDALNLVKDLKQPTIMMIASFSIGFRIGSGH